MAYATSTQELADIETTAQTVTDALETASGIVDSRALPLYETPVDFDDIDDSDAKTRDQARIQWWTRSVAASLLTAHRPGQSEKVAENYAAAIADMERVRSGMDVLASLTLKDAVILAANRPRYDAGYWS